MNSTNFRGSGSWAYQWRKKCKKHVDRITDQWTKGKQLAPLGEPHYRDIWDRWHRDGSYRNDMKRQGWTYFMLQEIVTTAARAGELWEMPLDQRRHKYGYRQVVKQTTAMD